MQRVTPCSLATAAACLPEYFNRDCCWQQARHQIEYSLLLLQPQNCLPHPWCQRSGKVKFDHRQTVTPYSLATAAACFPEYLNRDCFWQQARHQIRYSLFLVQLQKCRPHPWCQRSGKVKFDHMQTVTLYSLLFQP
jgi:hypothetical protein